MSCQGHYSVLSLSFSPSLLFLLPSLPTGSKLWLPLSFLYSLQPPRLLFSGAGAPFPLRCKSCSSAPILISMTKGQGTPGAARLLPSCRACRWEGAADAVTAPKWTVCSAYLYANVLYLHIYKHRHTVEGFRSDLCENDMCDTEIDARSVFLH